MKLSIFGPRGCGKTTYITCLYGQGGKIGSFAISAKDEPTRNYLAERWFQLINGTEIAPTALGTVPVNLVFSANQKAYNIQLKDFAGALVMREKSRNALKEKFKEILFKSFQESSGLMIFIEAGEVDFQAQFNRRLEIDALLEVLQSQSRRELITRPIAIVITKWDKVASTVNGNSDQTKEAENFIRKEYNNLYALLHECADNIKIFASSAYGFKLKDKDGNIDLHKISPFNLEKPFIWIGETIDKLNFKRCELFEKDNPNNLRSIINEYDKFCSKVNNGPLYEKAKERKRVLSNRLIQKRVRKYGIITCILCILSLGLLFLYEQNEVNNLLLSMESENVKADSSKVINEADYYLQSYRIFGNLWKKDVKNKLITFQKYTEKSSFEAIEKLSKIKLSDEDAINEFIIKLNNFAQAYPNSNSKTKVLKLIQEQKNSLRLVTAQKQYQSIKVVSPTTKEELEKYISEGKKYLVSYPEVQWVDEIRNLVKGWKEKLVKLEKNEEYRNFLEVLISKNSPVEYCKYCKSYLEQNSTLPLEIKEKIKEKIRDKEEEVFDDAKNKSFESDFQVQVEGFKNYLTVKIFKIFKKEAQKRLREIEKNFYDKMRKLGTKENINTDNAEKIYQDASLYLKHAHYRKHADKVKNWIDWYKDVSSKSKDYKVRIVSATLGKQCKMFERSVVGVWYPDTQVKIKYNGSTDETIVVPDAWNPKYDKTTTLNWRLGNQNELVLEVHCFDWSNTSCSWTSPDYFIPKYINKDIIINNGKDHITVVLKCNDMLFPELPAY